MDEVTEARFRAEGERLNAMSDEVLGFNLQGVSREDHIGAAEALLAFYEQSVKVQLELAVEMDGTVVDEGSLALYRLAAELHVSIAEALR